MLIYKIIERINEDFHQQRILRFLNQLNLKIIFDVGAHKGEFLSKFLKLQNVQKIYAFEPQKKCFNELKLNFSSNLNIIFENIALSNKIGEKIIKINKATSSTTISEIDENNLWYRFKNFILLSKSPIVDQYKISTNTLDNYFKLNKIDHIDLLKIDVEGHDLRVLKGSCDIIEKKIKYVLIECLYSKMYKENNYEDIHNFLKEKKFKLIKKFRFPLLYFEDRLYLNTMK